MSRYLAITLTVEVEVEQDLSDEQCEYTAQTVRAVVKTAIPDAVDVHVDEYRLEEPYVRGKRKPGR